MIKDKLNPNIYYICHSLSNVYSVEISWINQNQAQQNRIEKGNIQNLIKSNYLIKTNNKGQWLKIISKIVSNQQKDKLHFILFKISFM
jgi:hypothetical protein